MLLCQLGQGEIGFQCGDSHIPRFVQQIAGIGEGCHEQVWLISAGEVPAQPLLQTPVVRRHVCSASQARGGAICFSLICPRIEPIYQEHFEIRDPIVIVHWTNMIRIPYTGGNTTKSEGFSIEKQIWRNTRENDV